MNLAQLCTNKEYGAEAQTLSPNHALLRLSEQIPPHLSCGYLQDF